MKWLQEQLQDTLKAWNSQIRIQRIISSMLGQNHNQEVIKLKTFRIILTGRSDDPGLLADELKKIIARAKLNIKVSEPEHTGWISNIVTKEGIEFGHD